MVRIAASGLVAAQFTRHLNQSPAIAIAGLATSVVLTLGWRVRWTALVAAILSFALAQGTEGWAIPLLLALFVAAPRQSNKLIRCGAILAAVVFWSAAAASGLGVLGFLNACGWPNLGAMALVHVLALNPAWIPGRRGGLLDTVYYDGNCGLCHHVVEFLIPEDVDGSRFRFAPLDSDVFRNAVPEADRASLPDSVVVQTEGRVLVESMAALHLLSRLGGLWRLLAWVGCLVPESWANALYRLIARSRRSLFAQPEGMCPLMPPELRGRFLP